MNNVIEQNEAGDGVVCVGESQSMVSVKTYQAIYHQVTGRTEQIRQRYSENLLIDFPELEQLHHKVVQLCDVHRVVAKNESIAFFTIRNARNSSRHSNDFVHITQTPLGPR